MRGWAKKGSKPIAVSNYQHKYIHVFGARSKCNFVFSFCKKKSKKRFVKFLKSIHARWGRVFLATDNAPWHKGKEIDSFLKSNSKTFRILYFLKYTPELNPIEQCWKPARRKLSNRLLRSLPAMQYHLCKVFNTPKGMPKMFKYLTD